MNEQSSDILKSSGFCPHGNFPASCEICNAESKQVVESATKKFRQHDDPKRKELEESIADKPYVVEREIGQQRLAFFGSDHTSDPENPSIKEVRIRRGKFLATIPAEKAVFMVEGIIDGIDLQKTAELLASIESEDEAVRRFGEAGALMWVAKEQGIEITSPEIPENQVVQELQNQGFAAEEIALTLLLKDFTSSIGRSPEQPRDEQFRQESLKNFAREFYYLQRLTGVSWIKDVKPNDELAVISNDPEKFKEYMLKITAEAIGGANEAFKKIPGMENKNLIPSLEALLNRDKIEIPMDDVNALYDPLDENGRQAVTNRVASAYNVSRDQYLTAKIYETLKDGKSPFVLYGASHAITVEPALDDIVEKIKSRNEA